ncbi:hypothetical protein [Rhodococcus sp. WB1]|uniref:hypothetical protein n=1 Tax=Rhodococcus sp. WB1 TaxID=1033922 RepID=UPI003FA7BD6C
MDATNPPPLVVVPPGTSQTGDLGPIGVEFKLWGRDTGGALSVVEHPFPVGALVPPHLHTREDEFIGIDAAVARQRRRMPVLQPLRTPIGQADRIEPRGVV